MFFFFPPFSLLFLQTVNRLLKILAVVPHFLHKISISHFPLKNNCKNHANKCSNRWHGLYLFNNQQFFITLQRNLKSQRKVSMTLFCFLSLPQYYQKPKSRPCCIEGQGCKFLGLAPLAGSLTTTYFTFPFSSASNPQTTTQCPPVKLVYTGLSSR